MGLPKIKKPSELREQLYGTLDSVCDGERFIIPTKNGEVVLIQKTEYDLLIDDLELLKEFDEPIVTSQLVDHYSVWTKIEKRFDFKNENKVDKKGRKQSK